jgi:hypothetical protein
LDEDVMSVSHHGHEDNDDHSNGFLRASVHGDGLTMPFAPDRRAKPDGPSPTLAPEFQEDPLDDEQRNQRAASVPTHGGGSASGTSARRLPPSTSSTDRHRRQSLSVLGNGFPGFTPSHLAPNAASSSSSATPSTAPSPSVSGSISSSRTLPSSPSSAYAPTRVRSMPSSALMQLEERPANEKYMKLELEVDFEVELTCRGVRTRSGTTSTPSSAAMSMSSSLDGETIGRSDASTLRSGHDRGVSLVDKEEVGRLLSSGLNLGDKGGFLNLGL